MKSLIAIVYYVQLCLNYKFSIYFSIYFIGGIVCVALMGGVVQIFMIAAQMTRIAARMIQGVIQITAVALGIIVAQMLMTILAVLMTMTVAAQMILTAAPIGGRWFIFARRDTFMTLPAFPNMWVAVTVMQ